MGLLVTALVIGVGFFPVDPLKVLWDAENGLLRSLLRILERRPASASAEMETDPDMDPALAASHEVHRKLTILTQARATAATWTARAIRMLSRSARPIGEVVEINPLVASASSTVTSLYSILVALATSRTTSVEP